MHNNNGEDAINNYGSLYIHPINLSPRKSKSKYSSFHDGCSRQDLGIMTSAISRSHALATSTYLESVRGHPLTLLPRTKTRYNEENIVCFIRLSKKISIESKTFALPNTGFFIGLPENAIGTSLIKNSPILMLNRRMDVGNSSLLIFLKSISSQSLRL